MVSENPENDLQEIKAALRAEFPGWQFIVSTTGRWWATRGPLPADRINEIECIDADSLRELRERLREAGHA